ncbi:MAG: DUF2341 domain-containing protein, partial [Bacteroidales bacterium]|nr:DUF2341 domain-containing protein [Bacteroidales bacterium]
MLRSRLTVVAFLVLLLSVVGEATVSAQWMDGYVYRKKLTIRADVIPDGPALKDFPVLVDITNIHLRLCTNGGMVNNSSGYDIVFTSNDGTTLLFHEMEKYDPVTGRTIAWIRIPSLQTTVNTEIYIYFGNPTITSSQSSESTWTSGYKGVW